METVRELTFTAGDGRPFEIEWHNEESAGHLWTLNDSHHAAPLSPLSGFVMLDAPGRLRAYAEAGVHAPILFRGFEVQNGFQYTRADPLTPDEQAEFVARSRAFAKRHGGACNVWPQYSLPRIQRTLEWMRQAPPETSVRDLVEAHNYAFHLTHVAGQTMFVPLINRLTGLITGPFESADAALLCQEVGHGADNETVASDRAIAKMADLAKRYPGLRQRLADGTMPSRADEPEAGDFFDALEDYLEAYRFRARSWGIDHPTLEEQPVLALDMVRSAMSAPQSPDERRRAALETRDAAVAKIRKALEAEPEKLAQAMEVIAELGEYVAVREGRAHWQLMAAGTLRTRILAKGDVLVERGEISSREDVLYLLPDEIEAVFEQDALFDYRATVSARRGRRESWLGVQPPRMLTGNPALMPSAPPAAAEPGVIAGIPGSRGTVTARARIILDLSDADTLEEGEVLVCLMTSPPWTPLFGVACAIVTDSGMAFSHPAIAAREYGIPCVVGTYEATRRIRTGDLIEVNGDAGVVRILASA